MDVIQTVTTNPSFRSRLRYRRLNITIADLL